MRGHLKLDPVLLSRHFFPNSEKVPRHANAWWSLLVHFFFHPACLLTMTKEPQRQARQAKVNEATSNQQATPPSRQPSAVSRAGGFGFAFQIGSRSQHHNIVQQQPGEPIYHTSETRRRRRVNE
jgi:hypothetical protein